MSFFSRFRSRNKNSNPEQHLTGQGSADGYAAKEEYFDHRHQQEQQEQQQQQQQQHHHHSQVASHIPGHDHHPTIAEQSNGGSASGNATRFGARIDSAISTKDYSAAVQQTALIASQRLNRVTVAASTSNHHSIHVANDERGQFQQQHQQQQRALPVPPPPPPRRRL